MIIANNKIDITESIYCKYEYKFGANTANEAIIKYFLILMNKQTIIDKLLNKVRKWRKKQMNIEQIKDKIKQESQVYFKSAVNTNERIVTHLLTDIGLDMMACYDLKEDKFQFFILNEIPQVEILGSSEKDRELQFYDSTNRLNTIKNFDELFNYVDNAIFNTNQPFYPIDEKYVDISSLTFADIVSMENADMIAWFMQRVDLSKIMNKDTLQLIDSEEIKGSKYNLYKYIGNADGRTGRALQSLTFIEYWCPTSGRHYIQPSQFQTCREHLTFMNGGIDFAEEGVAFQI